MHGLIVCREAVSNPDTLRQILNPQNLQAMMQMQQAMSQLQQSGVMPGGGVGSGMGGGLGGEPPGRGQAVVLPAAACHGACFVNGLLPSVRAKGFGMGSFQKSAATLDSLYSSEAGCVHCGNHRLQ